MRYFAHQIKYSVAERSSLARPLQYQRPRLLSQAEHLPVEIESASSSFGLPYDAVGVGIQDAHEREILVTWSQRLIPRQDLIMGPMCVCLIHPLTKLQGKLQSREGPKAIEG